MGLWITKIAFFLALNAATLYAADYFIDGFEIAAGWQNLAIVAVIFTLINTFIKPVIKLILSPLIIITLGLGLIFVNAAMLYFLDFISNSVIISGITPLIYATIVISITHFILSFFVKRLA